MKLLISAVLTSILFFTCGCGPKAFVKGEYDDVQRENLMTDQWSETDMQVIVKAMVQSMLANPQIANAKTPPVVVVAKLQNNTSDHIDTQSILDMIAVELSQSGKITFVNKTGRDNAKEEYDYNNSGMVSEETKKVGGGQIGADYFIDGSIASTVQEAGKDKTVYYKLTLKLTNLKTNLAAWMDHKEIRKKFKKKTMGL